MRAAVNIPNDLLAEVQTMAGTQSKTKAIITAMEEFVKLPSAGRLASNRSRLTLTSVSNCSISGKLVLRLGLNAG